MRIKVPPGILAIPVQLKLALSSIDVPLFVSKRIDLGKVVSNPSFGVDLTSLRIGKSS